MRGLVHESWRSQRGFVVKSHYTDGPLKSDTTFSSFNDDKSNKSNKNNKTVSDGQVLGDILETLATLCVCDHEKTPKKARTKRRVVYPIQAITRLSCLKPERLNSKRLVEDRRRQVEKEHFFRPVSEDDSSIHYLSS